MGMTEVLILMVRFGVPVGILFAAGCWHEWRHPSQAADRHPAKSQRAQVEKGKMIERDNTRKEMPSNPTDEIRWDAPSPSEMARKAEDIGVAKAQLDFWSMFALAVLAGAFIAIGADFSALVQTGNGLGYGINKLVGGLVFSIGLILVVVAGAELFTGNNLIVIAWLSGRITLAQLLRNWAIVYAGNFVGSAGIAAIVYLTGQWSFAGGEVGAMMLDIAHAKVGLTFIEALARGTLCNILVCLAVWMCLSGRSTMDKILASIFPISAFVASGFEHSIANMYCIPIGLLLKDHAGVMAAAGRMPGELTDLCILGFIRNLIPVTIGNIIGGALMVAAIYWFIYLRPKEAREQFVARRVLRVLQHSPAALQGRIGRSE
jgi:formate transporter